MLIKRLATLATSLAIGLGLVVAQPASAATATAPSITPTRSVTTAQFGAGYLARQIDAGGGHLISFGAPDISGTAYAVLGLHAAGVGDTQAKRAIAFLKTQVTHLQGSDGKDDPALLGYIIMAAVASNNDPHRFGGGLAVNNLVARLRATVRTTGVDKGLFGTASPSFDGSFRQGVALAALAAVDLPKSAVTTSIAWLTKQQCSNGMWESYRTNTNTPCPPANPNTFAGPDTNSTSMAVQGLAAYGVHPQKSHVLASFARVQTPDGGYPFLATTGQSSDPDSTALVIQALIAEGVKPNSALGALASFQLGCSDPVNSRGAYFFPGSRSPNGFATVQAVPAAALRSFPIAASTASTRVPSMTCPPTANTASNVLVAAVAPAVAPKVPASTVGPCPGKTGVTVTVDFTAFKGVVRTRCAPGAQANGLVALQHAGFTATGTQRYGLAFICRINGLPTLAQQKCVTTPPPTAYWAFYHATATATTWTYSTVGASSYKPALGTLEAFAFGKTAKPTKTPAQVRSGK